MHHPVKQKSGSLRIPISMELDFFLITVYKSQFFVEREQKIGPDPTLRNLEKRPKTAKGPPKRIPIIPSKRLKARKKLQQKTQSTKRDPNIKLHPLFYENNGSLEPGTHQSLIRSLAPASAFLRYPIFSSPLPARALVSTGSPRARQQRAWEKGTLKIMVSKFGSISFSSG